MRLRNYNGFVLLSFLMVAGISCKHSPIQNVASKEKPSLFRMDAQPEITFDTLEHDFGNIHQGEKVGWYFKFRNTGGSDLILTHVNASCGCTVVEYSREPVHPGGEGTIRVVFDSSGRSGKQLKKVTVESNAKTLIRQLTLIAHIIN